MRYRVIQIEFILSIIIAIIVIALFLLYAFTGLKTAIEPFWFVAVLLLLFVMKRQVRLEVMPKGIFLTLKLFGLRPYMTSIILYEDVGGLELKEGVISLVNEAGRIAVFEDFIGISRKGSSIIGSHLMFPPYLIASNFRQFVIEVLKYLKGVRTNENAKTFKELYEFDVDDNLKIV